MTRSRQTPDLETPDIRVALDTVCFIISKAREFDVKSGSTDPSASALDEDDMDAAVLEDRPSDPVEAELRSYISDLSDGAQIDLVAIMWLGRGDGPDDWAEAQALATSEHNDRTASYLVGTPLLCDYLEEGLATIGRDCSDYNENNV
ncbi:MAG: DUF3775 domain-containing protein [Silicimonas sp.]|nr:DUF3775 domain-containing protein [Silicimonas sp.]NNF90313.1 DUF3775 domain-containing protein [Boseongicola sp.]RZW11075.1 MAG: DUF3775 domain-containing protein [Paracoccaceae bacterium]MBT8425758.1 DUF3775 domain-containing protein [Silicimonas sp.]NNL34455.1 DUF3775 domain-containing protein [Silicimonas sp.]